LVQDILKIMRIDIFLEDDEQPTMIYKITSVKKEAVDDKLLLAKKTEPLYQLTDMSYGMSVLGIMMGGMGITFGRERLQCRVDFHPFYMK